MPHGSMVEHNMKCLLCVQIFISVLMFSTFLHAMLHEIWSFWQGLHANIW